MITRDDLFVSIVNGPSGDSLFSPNHPGDINIEIPTFHSPALLDGDWMSYVGRIRRILEKNGCTCGMHGPFYDLAYHSHDPLVREVAEKRLRQGLRIAAELDARYIVFHSTYNQFVAEPGYWRKWPENAIRGLRGLVEDAEKRRIPIVMENIWDDRPEAIRGLLDLASSGFLKACIDVGHFNLFSKSSLKDWLDVLSGDIAHFHLHNNFGRLDDHNSLESGTFDFAQFFTLLGAHGINATYTIEIQRIEGIDTSIRFLHELGALKP
ncbi:MAG: sugar phosphate isomerase/epimerase family protein [bacterium]